MRGQQSGQGRAPAPRRGVIGLPAWGLAVVALTALVVAGDPLAKSFTLLPFERFVDLAVYREAAVSVLQGRPVYDHLTDSPNLLPFTYPPVAALAALPLVPLPEDVLRVLWAMLNVALLAALCAVAFRPLLARYGRGAPLLLGALAGLACWLQPIYDTLRLGQVNLILVALVLADYVAREPRWPRGMLVGVATAIKLTPGVFIVHLWLAGQRREAVTAALTAAGLTVAAALALPEASVAYWTRAIFDSERLGDNEGTANQSLRGVLLRLGPEGRAGTLLWLLLAAAVAAYGFRVAVRASHAGETVVAVAVVGLLAALLSPVAWIHHTSWVVLVVGALLGDGRRWPRAVLAAAVTWVFYSDYSYQGLWSLTWNVGPRPWALFMQQAIALSALACIVLLDLAVLRRATPGEPARAPDVREGERRLEAV